MNFTQLECELYYGICDDNTNSSIPSSAGKILSVIIELVNKVRDIDKNSREAL